MGLCWRNDLGFTIGERRINIRATAELHAEQHIDRIGEIVGQVEDGRIEADQVQVGEAGARPYVVKSNFYSVEAARQWINSEPGNTLIRAVIEKYEK